jgi:hypothetical protein
LKKLQYLDKRDNRGVLLRYSAHELAFDVSKKALDLISNSEIYAVLVGGIQKKHIDLYYQKMIYEAFLPLSHQLVIFRHDKENYGDVPVCKINANGFPSKALLNEVWPANSPDFSFSYLYKIRNIVKEKVKQLLIWQKRIISIFLSINKSNSLLNQPSLGSVRIAMNYVDGFDPNKRSDIFWFENSGIDPGSLVVYYENHHMMIRHDNKQTGRKYFEMKGINQVRLWDWIASKTVKPYNLLFHEIKSQKCSNDIDKWLKKTAFHLCNRSSYWSSFFEDHNIKIHLDPTESGLNTIIKQIAINQIGGISIGKMRSYPNNFKGNFFGYYPNDVFFVWGRDSANRLQKQANIKQIVISGFPYNSSSNSEAEKRKVTKKIKVDHISPNFNILLLDTNHSSNKNIMQVVDSLTMKKFYTGFLDWVLEDNSVSLIIKPKKTEFLNNMPEIVEHIKLAKKTGRVKLINSPFQKSPSTYIKGIDMVVGISAFMPAAVLECVIHGKRAVFYDYPNLRRHELNLYNQAEDKVIFPNLEKMITSLKDYKRNHTSRPDIGDWSKIRDSLDPFSDGRGGARIGNYIRLMQKSLNEGHNPNTAITQANCYYSNKWGIDKTQKQY